MAKKNKTVVTACPCCGNEIEVSARQGEVRKCPFCRWHYVVEAEIRKRKVLSEYIKVNKKGRNRGAKQSEDAQA